MKEVSVTELRQNLQAHLASVSRGGHLRVTSRGRVIAEITPPSASPEVVGQARMRLRSSVIKYEAPLEPAVESEDWDMHR